MVNLNLNAMINSVLGMPAAQPGLISGQSNGEFNTGFSEILSSLANTNYQYEKIFIGNELINNQNLNDVVEKAASIFCLAVSILHPFFR